MILIAVFTVFMIRRGKDKSQGDNGMAQEEYFEGEVSEESVSDNMIDNLVPGQGEE